MNDSKPSLKQAIPVLCTGDMAASAAFFQRLGFEARYNDGSYAIIQRDGIELHLSLMEGLAPAENQHECRINVSNAESLFREYRDARALHPNTEQHNLEADGSLKVQPYGMKEFAVLDPGGICVIFGERVTG